MNYRHQYHAGNFSDVLKHTVLLALLEALSRKPNPWCYLDTHAGRGYYDLGSEEAQKTLEYQLGIEKIMQLSALTCPTLQKYQALIQQSGYPHYYPGSPSIVHRYLRENDRMILIEKHPEEVQFLKRFFENKLKHVAIHQQDGYEALKAFLPPKERRGLILIDPAFEESNEWKRIIEGLEIGYKRFSTGIFAIWYPIKHMKEVRSFHQALSDFKKRHSSDILLAELSIYPEDVLQQGLKGAGMAIINPPWQIEVALQDLLAQLFSSLSLDGKGRFEVKMMT